MHFSFWSWWPNPLQDGVMISRIRHKITLIVNRKFRLGCRHKNVEASWLVAHMKKSTCGTPNQMPCTLCLRYPITYFISAGHQHSNALTQQLPWCMLDLWTTITIDHVLTILSGSHRLLLITFMRRGVPGLWSTWCGIIATILRLSRLYKCIPRRFLFVSRCSWKHAWWCRFVWTVPATSWYTVWYVMVKAVGSICKATVRTSTGVYGIMYGRWNVVWCISSGGQRRAARHDFQLLTMAASWRPVHVLFSSHINAMITSRTIPKILSPEGALPSS